MSEDKEKDAGLQKLDLSGLDALSLGPDWGSTENAPKTPSYERFEQDERGDASRGRQRRDRRGERLARKGGPGGGPGGSEREGRPPYQRQGGQPDRERGGRDRSRDRGRGFGQGPDRDRPPFKPVVEVQFFPEDNPFKVLTQAIRTSCRTFELFEIARLILDKPERYVCLVKHPEQKEGEAALLWATVQDGLPFMSEQAALEHVFRNSMDQFFDIEEVEVDPPTGNFQMIHRCGLTGELIGPPNYHRYQALLQEHHKSRIHNMSLERFKERLESVREKEVIDAWLEKMKKQRRYVLKGTPEEEAKVSFDALEEARLFLVTRSKDKLVRPAYSARFSGKALELLPPHDEIRRSVEFVLQQQHRFPLETANHLRGRLRRMNFAVYKKGSKGISFVCAVKRRFRLPGEVLADNLDQLITFVDDHPMIRARDLQKEYLGIVVPETAEEAEATLTDSDKEAITALRRDLHYLVSQGYIIEYSDGRLLVPPMKEGAKDKDEPESELSADQDAGDTAASQEQPEDAEEATSTEPEATAAATAEESVQEESDVPAESETTPSAQAAQPEVEEEAPAQEEPQAEEGAAAEDPEEKPTQAEVDTATPPESVEAEASAEEAEPESLIEEQAAGAEEVPSAEQEETERPTAAQDEANPELERADEPSHPEAHQVEAPADPPAELEVAQEKEEASSDESGEEPVAEDDEERRPVAGETEPAQIEEEEPASVASEAESKA